MSTKTAIRPTPGNRGHSASPPSLTDARPDGGQADSLKTCALPAPPEPGIASVRVRRGTAPATDTAPDDDPAYAKTQSVMSPCGLSPAVNPAAARERFRALLKGNWQKQVRQSPTARPTQPLPAAKAVDPAAAMPSGGGAVASEMQAAARALGTDSAAPRDYASCWRAAQQGDTEAQYALGVLFATGDSRVPHDDARAAQWLRKAAETGHPRAKFGLGILMQHGRIPSRRENEGLAWIRDAADAGCAAALHYMGRQLLRGDVVKADPTAARACFLQAAKAGVADAQAALAGMLEKGLGGPADARQAREWAERAAEAGSTEGQYLWGCMLGRRGASAADTEAARAWLHKAAAQGHEKAAVRTKGLALLTDAAVEAHPLPLPQDKARKLRRLADRGDADAQCALGALYAENRHFPEAAKWFRLAAEQGHAGGQNRLAGLYATGSGLEFDPQAAAYWFYQAASQDLTDAQYWLGELYAAGCGVPQEPLRAYKWLKLAANKGDRDAKLRCRALLKEHHRFL